MQGSNFSLAEYLPMLAAREYKLFISHEWDYNDDYSGLVRLLNGEVGFKWVDFSIPKSDPLPTHPALTKSYRYLVRQVDEQVRQVDCLLVIAGMYLKHRGWIQSEIDAALEFKKPVIAVLPFGSERVPSELNAMTVTEWVGWRGSSITSAVRKHAPVLLPRLGAFTPPPLPSRIMPANLLPVGTSDALSSGLKPPPQFPRLQSLLSELNPKKK